jgi:hypothetical protein
LHDERRRTDGEDLGLLDADLGTGVGDVDTELRRRG